MIRLRGARIRCHRTPLLGSTGPGRLLSRSAMDCVRALHLPARLTPGKLLMITVIACAGLHVCFVAGAISGEYVFDDSLQLDGPVWQLAVSYGIPLREQQPTLVMYGVGLLRYVDGTNLEELSHRYLPESGWEISPNGKYIAMCTQSSDEERKARISWFRVGDWKGDLVWHMRLNPCQMIRIANSGHSVIFPAVHPGDMTGDHGCGEWTFEPPVWHHGLLVHNVKGKLVIEGIKYGEWRYPSAEAAVSPDGGYLAVLFRWVPEEFRESRHRCQGDKACLVLYNLQAGVELWRHYFDEKEPNAVAVGPEAERILCFVEPSRGTYPRDSKMVLLDKSGRELRHERVRKRGRIRSRRSLSSSADGRLSVFIDNDKRVYVIEMYDGGIVLQWTHPADMLYGGSFGVSSDGRVAIYGKDLYEGEEGPAISNVYVNSRDGTLIQVIPLDFPINPAAASVCTGISEDGSMLWTGHRSVRLYRWH